MNRAHLFSILRPLIRNKYIIATVLFVVWIGIFDQNNLIDRYKLASRIRQLKHQKEHYQVEIDQNKRKMEELQSSTKNLEKFAREEYLMKKKNEVIFVVEED
ncbi:MAG: septum formation initiator family protein [Deltaproteobacteria bacterium]|nr:septum formation initiator family protein [Deltaproteobacteria bacterium]